MIRLWLQLAICLSALLFGVAHGRELPAALTAALVIKVIGYEEHLAASQTVTLLVVADENLYTLLQRQSQALGGKFRVSYAEHFSPAQQADVVFLGNKLMPREEISEVRSKARLLLSDHYELLERGAHLILFEDDGVPGIALRVSADDATRVKWNPEILNYATSVLKN